MIKKIIKIFSSLMIALLVLILLLLAGAHFYAKTDHAQNMIKQRANAAIPGQIDWDKADISLLTGSISIHGANVSDPEQNTVVDADVLFLDIGIIEFLRGTIEIVANFENPRVMLLRDSDGSMNIVRTFVDPDREKPDREEKVKPEKDEIKIKRDFPFNITLPSVRISEGFFAFHDEFSGGGKSPGKIIITNINVEIDYADMAGRTGRGLVEIGGGHIDMAGILVDVAGFSFESIMDNGKIQPARAELALKGENGGPRLVLSGGAENVFKKDAALDLTLEATAELSDIKRMLSLNIPLSGKTTVTLEAAGTPADPELQFTARYGGGNLPGVDVEEAELQARMADMSVDLQRLYARIDGAALHMTGVTGLRNAFANGLFAAPTDLDAITYNLEIAGKDIAFDRLYWTKNFMSGAAEADIALDGTGIFPKTISAGIDANIRTEKIAVENILSPIDPEIVIKGGMDDGKAFADSVNIAKRGGRIGVSGSYDIFEHVVAAAIDLESPDMAQFLAPLNIPASSGETRLSAQVAGPAMNPEIQADLDAKQLGFAGIRIGDLLLNARLDQSGRLALERLHADNRGSVVEITGHLDLFDGRFSRFNADLPAELAATFKRVEISRFYPQLDLTGEINGTLAIEDKIMAPAAKLRLDAADMAFDETRIGDIDAEMALVDGTLDIAGLLLENRRSTIQIAGTADLFAPGSLSLLKDPKLDFRFFESAVFIGDFTGEAGGRIAIDGHARGPVTDLEAGLMLAGTDLQIAGHHIGTLSAKVGLKKGRVYADPLEIENRDSKLAVTGGVELFAPRTIELQKNPAIDMEIAGDNIHIRDFVTHMDGKVSVAGQVGGTLKDPAGSIRIQAEQIDFGVQKIEGIDISATFKEKTVFFEEAAVVFAPGEEIRADGRITMDKRFVLHIESGDIDINRIGVLADTGVDGKMRLNVTGSGSFDDPYVNGNISLHGLQAGQTDISPLDVDFGITHHTAYAHADGGFTAEALYQLDNGDFEFHGKFDETPLDPVFDMADLTGLTGSVTAEINARGNAFAPKQSFVDMTIANMAVFHDRRNTAPLELIQIAGLTADFKKGAFTIPQTEIALLQTDRVLFGGSGHIDGSFEFHAEGNVPLAAATFFVPDLLKDPEGEIRFSSEIIRTNANALPVFSADIQMHELGLAVPTLMQKLHGVNGSIRVTNEAVVLDDITGRLDAGRFKADGSIGIKEDLSPGQAYIAVNAHSLPIRVPGILDVTVNSDLTFSGTPDDSLLSGQVILLEGLYYKDVEINLIGEVTRRRRAAPVAAEPIDIDAPYLRNLKIDIETGFRRPLMVDNNIALMTLRPELTVNGTISRPQVTGRAEVAQGTVSYQNIEFDITRGILDFIDPYRIAPDIDIKATSRVRKWDILLEVSGTSDDLEFTLTSNPPEEHADILSLILLGQTTRELAGGTGPAGPSPEEMLVNLLSGRVEKDIRAGTGLDIVELEYTQGDLEKNDQAVRLTVGMELSRRLTVTYGVERKSGETVQQQTATYRLLEFLSMSAFQDTAGTFGSEMRFRLEFR